MDPLSVTASVLAILTAAQKISAYITTITSKSKKAPEEMLELKSTVDTTHAVLMRLQALLLEQTILDPSRPTLVLVDQVVIILASCVKIFSDLGEMLKALDSGVKIAILDRVRWATKTEEVREYLAKLEMQKNSLNLILTILTWFEANRAVGRLEDLVTRVLGQNEVLAQHMLMVPGHTSMITANRPPAESSLAPVELEDTTTVRVSEFQHELDSSQVYSRSRWGDNDAFSIGSRADVMVGPMPPGLSLSDVSNIGSLPLPVTIAELSSDLLSNTAGTTSTTLPPATFRAAESNGRHFIFMASTEYWIKDRNIKLKVVPCFKNINYSFGQVEQSVNVSVADNNTLVSVRSHRLQNITFILLDCDEFRSLNSGDGDDHDYPMTPHYCAIWNQSIAKVMQRYDFDEYLVYDMRSALALLYILPQTVPCRYLHLEFGPQLWRNLTRADLYDPIETHFRLQPFVVQRYFGSVQRLDFVFMIASYLKFHQSSRSFINVGHKNTYDFNGRTHQAVSRAKLNTVIHLDLPDPTDQSSFDPSLDGKLNKQQLYIDEGCEQQRPSMRHQIQIWAGLEQNPTVDIFLWVGRWTSERGVDLISNVMPTILQKYENTQLVCIGPIVDECGRIAAEKLIALQRTLPRRLLIKPEWVAVPPCVLGAEFAILPSRFDPWGLTAIEFARKGSICIGSTVGVGRSPGFWYKAREECRSELLERVFKNAIEDALKSALQKRVAMRAAAKYARFPVKVWAQKMDELRDECFRYHDKSSMKRKLL